MKNLILTTDSYKLSHFLQYPPGTMRVASVGDWRCLRAGKRLP